MIDTHDQGVEFHVKNEKKYVKFHISRENVKFSREKRGVKNSFSRKNLSVPAFAADLTVVPERCDWRRHGGCHWQNWQSLGLLR